ncbi:hypothetical protein C6P45_002708 [Maudiozyma exigua]|uniref:Prokaryotic-type class I peptide chain release factors domain-containing protein n=1 Tax=Maudiozyma exigua TaxID=34358 RepID=A0A9P7BCL7_MAUEX|nr:hypothetical protein C6P45_002708 [Kazachstania exigua]
MSCIIRIAGLRTVNVCPSWAATTSRKFGYSSMVRSDNKMAKKWLVNLSLVNLEPKYFHVRYDLASGPGGQNVNKVNTKCTLTLPDLSKCSLFPEEIKSQLISKRMKYYSPNSDSITIQSDETRSREQNRTRCFEKLVDSIKETCYFAKDADIKDIKRWQSIKERTKNLRLKQKKFNSEKKKTRKQLF